MCSMVSKIYNSPIGTIIKKSPIFYAYQRHLAYKFLKTNNVSYTLDKKTVTKDMVDMKIQRNFDFSEYFLFHFEGKDSSERDAFISNANRKKLTSNLNADAMILNNKYETYKRFSDFFYRDVCIYESEADTGKVRNFLSVHKEFIAKPIGANKGKGVRKMCVTDSVDSVLDELRSRYVGGVLLEEIIREDEILAQFHPLSVNTLRIATFATNNGIKCRFPLFRMGVGNTIIDNASAGGIFAAIDDSGTIIAVGDLMGHVYEKHPDTGIKFENFQIPLFSEACEMCKQLAARVSENKYCSWDLALSKGRWLMVEVNSSGNLAWQSVSGIGVKEEVEELCEQCLQ